MKIISQIPGDRVLVSLKADELANILGHYSGHDLKRDFYDDVIKSELELEVSDIYKKHRLINDLQKQNNYEKARTKLETMLSALKPIEDKIAKLSKV